MSYNNDPQKKCGFCGETIPARAGRCPYCGSILEVTFDNVYGGDQPNQPIQPAYPDMNPFPGGTAGTENGQVNDQTNSQIDARIDGQENDQAGDQMNGQENSRANSQFSGMEGNLVNNDTPNIAQNPESSGDPGQLQPQSQTQPQTPASAPAQYQPQQGGQGQWQNPERPVQNYQRPYYQNRPQQGQRYEKPALSNGLKVFLTILFTVLPGIGQLAGIITAIVFMSSEGDKDRRSFGVALLVACIILFVLSCIGCFILSIASASLPFSYNSNR